MGQTDTYLKTDEPSLLFSHLPLFDLIVPFEPTVIPSLAFPLDNESEHIVQPPIESVPLAVKLLNMALPLVIVHTWPPVPSSLILPLASIVIPAADSEWLSKVQSARLPLSLAIRLLATRFPLF